MTTALLRQIDNAHAWQPNRRVAEVQALEVRTTPRGTVMVAITATASVVITGDAAGNNLEVDATATQIVITGTDATSLSVKFNGGAAQVFSPIIPSRRTSREQSPRSISQRTSMTVTTRSLFPQMQLPSSRR